jgi:hypothetical protein
LDPFPLWLSALLSGLVCVNSICLWTLRVQSLWSWPLTLTQSRGPSEPFSLQLVPSWDIDMASFVTKPPSRVSFSWVSLAEDPRGAQKLLVQDKNDRVFPEKECWRIFSL